MSFVSQRHFARANNVSLYDYFVSDGARGFDHGVFYLRDLSALWHVERRAFCADALAGGAEDVNDGANSARRVLD